MMDDKAREALLRARSKLFGKSSKQTRAALEQLRSKGATRDGILGFGFMPRSDDGKEAIRVLVREKLSAKDLKRRKIAPIPRRIGGLRTDVFAELESATGSPSPGTQIKLGSGAPVGSLTFIIQRSGRQHAVSASHVIAGPTEQPQQGDSVWVDGGPAATLSAWSPLAAFATVVADVAVAQTNLPATTVWPDGRAFAGGRNYDPQNGPFTFFGYSSGARSGAGQAIAAGTTAIDLPGIGPVLYTAHALIAAASVGGDSGAGVCDAAGFLVGMVVGSTQAGQSCITPWQALGPAIDALLV